MEKWKRIVSIGLGILILGLLLAACSGSKEPAIEPAPANPAADSAKKEEPAKTTEPVKPAEPITISFMRYEHPSQAVVSDSVAIQEMLKRKNVKIDLQSVPQNNYNDKKKTLIATNTIPDVIQVNQTDLSSFADSGIFLDLTPYLDKGLMPNLKKQMESIPDINKTRVDGKLYGFPMVTHWNMMNGQLPMIRTDMLEKLNLKAPTTYEELYQVLKKFKEANPTSFPYTSRAANGKTGTQGLINPIAFGFGSGYTNITGVPIYYDNKVDKYQFGPFSPEFKDAMVYLNKLYSEKILDPDYTVSTSQIFQEKLSSGKSFYFADNTSFGVNFNKALQASDPNAAFDILPALISDKGVRRTQVYDLHHLAESFVISSKTKNPDQLVELFDWFYSLEGTMLLNNGVEGEHYTMQNGVPTPKQEVLDKYKDKQDPLRALYADLGAGYLGFGLNYDASFFLVVSPPERVKWSKAAEKQYKDGISFPEVNDPPFNAEEREKLKQLITKVSAHLTQNLDKFIITNGAIDKEWDGFVKELENMGAREIENIYNTAYNRIK